MTESTNFRDSTRARATWSVERDTEQGAAKRKSGGAEQSRAERSGG